MSKKLAAETVSPTEAIERDWQAVSDYLARAIIEVAESLDDEDLLDRVSVILEHGGILPDLEALMLIKTVSPQSVELVMQRAAEIQLETHQRQLAEVRVLRKLTHGAVRLLRREPEIGVG